MGDDYSDEMRAVQIRWDKFMSRAPNVPLNELSEEQLRELQSLVADAAAAIAKWLGEKQQAKTIRDLIEQARSDESLCRGECLEVHVGADDEYGVIGRTAVRKFLRDWGGLGADVADELESYCNTRWLGIVHDTGSLVIPLDDRGDGKEDGVLQ